MKQSLILKGIQHQHRSRLCVCVAMQVRPVQSLRKIVARTAYSSIPASPTLGKLADEFGIDISACKGAFENVVAMAMSELGAAKRRRRKPASCGITAATGGGHTTS